MKQRLVLLIFMFAALLSLQGCAGVVKPAEMEIVNRGAQNWSVPITMTSGRPTLTVTCQGKSLTMMIDTGGGDGFSIKQSAIEGMDFEVVGTAKVSDAMGNVSEVADIKLLDWHIGELHLDSLSGHAFDDSVEPDAKTSLAEGADGWIGWGFLKHYNCFFDFPAGTLELLPKSAWPTKDFPFAEIPYRETSIGIEVDALVNDMPITLCLDTGASHCVKRVASATGEKGFDVLPLTGLNIAGHDLVVKAGPETLDLIALPFQQPDVGGFLGMNLLRFHRLVILPDKKVILLAR